MGYRISDIRKYALPIIRGAQIAYIAIALSLPLGVYEATSGVPAFAQSESINSERIGQLREKSSQIDSHLAHTDGVVEEKFQVITSKIDQLRADDNKRFEDITDRQWWIIGVGAGAAGLLGILQAIVALGLRITRE